MPNRSVAPVAAPGWDTESILREFGHGEAIASLLHDGVVAGPIGLSDPPAELFD